MKMKSTWKVGMVSLFGAIQTIGMPMMSIQATTTPITPQGLIQLSQSIPEGQALPKGMSYDELRSQLYCKVNHTLTPSPLTKSSHETYVNSCYVDDALYVGETTDSYQIYLSGYEGMVEKEKNHQLQLRFYVNDQEEQVSPSSGTGQWKTYTYTVQTTATLIPFDNQMDYTQTPSHSNKTEETTDYLKSSQDLETLWSLTWDKITAWLNPSPLVSVQSPSFYQNEAGTLYHYISKNVTESKAYAKTIVGAAPEWMTSSIPYYSYDGVYFYAQPQLIQVNGTKAINADNPYYSYYQYVPIRSTTQLNGDELNAYLRQKGYTSKPQTHQLKSHESMLANEGQTFLDAQQYFGINGALQFAMGIHESGYGRSTISVTKSNLFGMNAVDANPTEGATAFSTVAEGVLYHADSYLSKGYSDPLEDKRYYGFYLGNKGGGMNVKYASDPFWGEKIAGHYYQLDQTHGSRDLNQYTIGIVSSKTPATLYSEPSLESPILYQTQNNLTQQPIEVYPLLVVGEEGDFYRVKTDIPLDAFQQPQYDVQYQWHQATGYILKQDVSLGNEGVYWETKAEDTHPWLSETALYEAFIHQESVALRSEPHGDATTLALLPMDTYVQVLGETGEWLSLQTSVGMGYVPKETIRAIKQEEVVETIDINTVEPIVLTEDTIATWNAGTSPLEWPSDILQLEAGQVFDFMQDVTVQEGYEVKVNPSSYHLRQVGTQAVQYVITKTETGEQWTREREIHIQDTTAPLISLKGDSTLYVEVGETYSEYGASITDNAEGVIDYQILGDKVLSQTLGTYEIVYQATDSSGNTSTATRTVIVRDSTAPVLILNGEGYLSLEYGQSYVEPGYSVRDNYDTHIEVQVDTSALEMMVPGTYTLAYIATDSSGNQTTMKRIVVIKPKVSPTHPNESVSSDETFSPKEENTSTIPSTPNVPSSETDETTQWGKSTINGLNVRREKSKSSASMGEISTTEVVQILEHSEGWYRIKFSKGEGYVYEGYLELVASPTHSTPSYAGEDGVIDSEQEEDNLSSSIPPIEELTVPDEITNSEDVESDTDTNPNEVEAPSEESNLWSTLFLTLAIGFTLLSLVMGGLFIYQKHQKVHVESEEPTE